MIEGHSEYPPTCHWWWIFASRTSAKFTNERKFWVFLCPLTICSSDRTGPSFPTSMAVRMTCLAECALNVTSLTVAKTEEWNAVNLNDSDVLNAGCFEFCGGFCVYSNRPLSLPSLFLNFAYTCI